ncbi:MAG: hypothetical protein ACO2PK_11720 [Armatimonadota bacterium]
MQKPSANWCKTIARLKGRLGQPLAKPSPPTFAPDDPALFSLSRITRRFTIRQSPFAAVWARWEPRPPNNFWCPSDQLLGWEALEGDETILRAW